MNRALVIAHWQARSAEWGRLGIAVDGRKICQEILAQLGQLWAAEDAAEVHLEEAASISGYSEDHLRRLVREGKLNAQRRGARLFFRAADLPRKPCRIANGTASSYDPDADARQVAARRNGED